VLLNTSNPNKEMVMKKARVLLWETCNRNCDGCCNKEWDLKALPKVGMKELAKYDEIILTGGEPMIYPEELLFIANGLRKKFPTKTLYLYTAKVDNVLWQQVMNMFDGVCVTLHEQADVTQFEVWALNARESHVMSKRLNVFKEVHLSEMMREKIKKAGWIIKDEMEWIKDCPLPNDEEFVRWKL
jgi:organic radical activating enzyme